METLKLRICELVSELPLNELSELLENIHTTRENLRDHENGTIKKFIEDIYDKSLIELLKRLGNEKGAIDNHILKLFYQMASLCGSYLPSPPLKATWEGLVNNFDEILSEAEKDGYIDKIKPLEEMTEYIEIVGENEPRFFRFIDFPNCIKIKIDKFVVLCIEDSKRRNEFDAEEKALYDLYDGERQRYEAIAQVVDKWLNLAIGEKLGRNLKDVLERLGKAAEHYNSEAQNYYIAEPDYDADGDVEGDRNISINKLFSDL
jgi:hypothetical protein